MNNDDDDYYDYRGRLFLLSLLIVFVVGYLLGGYNVPRLTG